MESTVTLLDSYGKPMSGFNRSLLDLCRLKEYIYKHQSKSGRYIFSSIDQESIGPNPKTNNITSSQSQSDVVYISTQRINNPYVNINPYLLMPQPVYEKNVFMNSNQIQTQQTSVVQHPINSNKTKSYLKNENGVHSSMGNK